MMRWTGPGSPQKWAFKYQMPNELKWRAIRVCFRWEIAWTARDENGRVLFPDNRWADCWDFRLTTPGHVIGLRDIETAQNERWADEWRQAAHDRIRESLQLRAA